MRDPTGRLRQKCRPGRLLKLNKDQSGVRRLENSTLLLAHESVQSIIGKFKLGPASESKSSLIRRLNDCFAMSGRSLTTHQAKTTCDNALGANLAEEGGRLDQILETVNYRKTPV